MKQSKESKAHVAALRNMTSDPAKWAPKPTPQPSLAKSEPRPEATKATKPKEKQ